MKAQSYLGPFAIGTIAALSAELGGLTQPSIAQQLKEKQQEDSVEFSSEDIVSVLPFEGIKDDKGRLDFSEAVYAKGEVRLRTIFGDKKDDRMEAFVRLIFKVAAYDCPEEKPNCIPRERTSTHIRSLNYKSKSIDINLEGLEDFIKKFERLQREIEKKKIPQTSGPPRDTTVTLLWKGLTFQEDIIKQHLTKQDPSRVVGFTLQWEDSGGRRPIDPVEFLAFLKDLSDSLKKSE